MNSTYLDIVVFAVIAVVLIWKLRNVLGQRTGNEREPRDILSRSNRASSESPQDKDGAPASTDNVIRLPSRNASVQEPVPEKDEPPEIASIHAVYPSFNPDEFLEGATMAFDMILTSFSEGDVKALRALLTPDVFKTFSNAIDARNSAGETLESQLITIRSAEIDDTRVDDSTVFVTVRFVSEQVSCLRDKDGNVIDGDEAHVLTLTDLWTFSRTTRSRDPNWFLAETRVVED